MTLRFASWTLGLSFSLFAGVVLAQEQPKGDGKEGKEKETPPTLSSSSREDKIFADLDKKPEFKGKGKPTDMNPMEVLPGERLYQMLMSLDGDNDKKLSQREFQRLPQTLPPPISFAVAPRTRDIFRELDANKDDSISADEARIGSEALVRQLGLDKLERGPGGGANDAAAAKAAQDVISFYDQSNDQAISEREARLDPQFGEVFGEIDRNRDGTANFEELFGYFRRQGGGENGGERRGWFGRGRGGPPMNKNN